MVAFPPAEKVLEAEPQLTGGDDGDNKDAEE